MSSYTEDYVCGMNMNPIYIKEDDYLVWIEKFKLLVKEGDERVEVTLEGIKWTLDLQWELGSGPYLEKMQPELTTDEGRNFWVGILKLLTGETTELVDSPNLRTNGVVHYPEWGDWGALETLTTQLVDACLGEISLIALEDEYAKHPVTLVIDRLIGCDFEALEEAVADPEALLEKIKKLAREENKRILEQTKRDEMSTEDLEKLRLVELIAKYGVPDEARTDQ